jgi:hypothetical protein
MKPDCSNCSHWMPRHAGARAETLAVGECRAQPPGRDFTWPRTKATDHCGSHAAGKPAAVAFATTSAATTPNRKPKLTPKTGALPLDP